MNTNRKITILGAGNVGATIAYTLTIKGLCSEIVFIDINEKKAQGEAMDIRQGTTFSHDVNIYHGSYADAANSDIVIVTLGSARKPGQTRLDLAKGNVNIIKSVMPQVVKYAPNALYLVVSNPVDILTYATIRCTGLPAKQVIGSGTLLDTSRLRSIIAERIDLAPQNVHAYVLGEHGDTQFVPWSLTAISGMQMDVYCDNLKRTHNFGGKNELQQIEEEVRTSGGKVIQLKGATFYAVSMSVTHLVGCLLANTSCVNTVSSMLNGEYGISDVCLSLPFVLDAQGVKQSLEPPMTAAEQEQLQNSANALKEIIKNLEF